MSAMTGIILGSRFRDPGMKPPWMTAAKTCIAASEANLTELPFPHATWLVAVRDTHARVIRVTAGS